MNFPHSVGIAILITLVALLCPMTALATEKPPALQDVLRLICDEANIAGKTCTDARGFPRKVDGEAVFEDQTCPVEILALYRVRARGMPFAIAPYHSNCSGHPDLGGGSLLIAMNGKGTPAKASFWPGKRAGDSWEFSYARHCVVIEHAPRDDRLYCISYYRSTGEALTWLVRYAVKDGRLVSDEPGFTMGRVAMMTGSVDDGVNTLDCGRVRGRPASFELSNLAKGPRPRTLKLDLSYADAVTVRQACRPDQVWPMKDNNGKQIVGFANVSATDTKHKTLIFDAATGLLGQER